MPRLISRPTMPAPPAAHGLDQQGRVVRQQELGDGPADDGSGTGPAGHHARCAHPSMVPDAGSGRAESATPAQLSRGPRGVIAMWIR